MALHHRIIHHAKRAHAHLRDHFVPHDGNNHKPHIFQHRVLLGYSVLLILLKAVTLVAPIALPSSSLYSSAITPKNIIALTNQTRENLELTPLEQNDLLMAAASKKAGDMLAKQYFAHTSPAGRTPWDWIKEVGYKYRYAGENLAVHFHEAEDVQAGWMASPTHRANIVNDRYTEIGVGTATGVFEGVSATFVVQMFGRPQVPVVTAAALPEPETIPVTKPVAVAPAPVTPSAGEEEPGSVAGETEVPAPTPEMVLKPATIDESSILVLPTEDGYSLRVRAENATNVTAYLVHEKLTLTRVGEDRWQGAMTVHAGGVAETGETLLLIATGTDGSTASAPVAIAAPGTTTQKLFTFNDGTDRFATFFGFLRIGNVKDHVRQFYIAFVVFLATALLLNLFLVRLKIHHPSVVAHTFAVMMLAIVLALV